MRAERTSSGISNPTEWSKWLDGRERDERGLLLPSSVTKLGFVVSGGVVVTLLASFGLNTVVEDRTEVEVTHGGATITAIETDVQEVCFLGYSTAVEGAGVKLSEKKVFHVPVIGDAVNVKPGMWWTGEINGVVSNKVCTPGGTLAASGQTKDGTYELVFKPTDEGFIVLHSYLEDTPVNSKPVYSSDRGTLASLSAGLEFFSNTSKKIIDSNPTYKNAKKSDALRVMAERVAEEDSAACLPKVMKLSDAAIKANLRDLWLGPARDVDPSIGPEDVTVTIPELPSLDDIQNQYGQLGIGNINGLPKSAIISEAHAEIDTDSNCKISDDISLIGEGQQ